MEKNRANENLGVFLMEKKLHRKKGTLTTHRDNKKIKKRKKKQEQNRTANEKEQDTPKMDIKRRKKQSMISCLFYVMCFCRCCCTITNGFMNI